MDYRSYRSRSCRQGTDQHNQNQLVVPAGQSLPAPSLFHLLDEATGRETPHLTYGDLPEIRNNVQDGGFSTRLPNQYRNREGYIDLERHTPRSPRRNQSTGATHRTEPHQVRMRLNDEWKAEIDHYVQETLAAQMTVMMDQFKQTLMQHLQQFQKAALAFRRSETTPTCPQPQPRSSQLTPQPPKPLPRAQPSASLSQPMLRPRPPSLPQVDFDSENDSSSETSLEEKILNQEESTSSDRFRHRWAVVHIKHGRIDCGGDSRGPTVTNFMKREENLASIAKLIDT